MTFEKKLQNSKTLEHGVTTKYIKIFLQSVPVRLCCSGTFPRKCLNIEHGLLKIIVIDDNFYDLCKLFFEFHTSLWDRFALQ